MTAHPIDKFRTLIQTEFIPLLDEIAAQFQAQGSPRPIYSELANGYRMTAVTLDGASDLWSEMADYALTKANEFQDAFFARDYRNLPPFFETRSMAILAKMRDINQELLLFEDDLPLDDEE